MRVELRGRFILDVPWIGLAHWLRDESMRKQSRMGLLAGLLLVLLTQFSLAWNNTGHKTASLIAWDQLTPEARANISALLLKHPQYGQYLAAKEPATTTAPATMAAPLTPEEKGLASYLAAAIWPDQVRTPTGKNPLYHHGTWHYVDYPFVLGTLPPEVMAPEEPVAEWKPGTDPENLLQAREKVVGELKNAQVAEKEKAVALAWLLHLTEDVHQPLHGVSLFNSEYPLGDKGGNSLMVTASGSVINLHAFWDGQLGRNEDPRAIRLLATQIETAYPKETFAGELKITDPKGWALESFAYAKEVVYEKGEIKATNAATLKADKKTPVPELSPAYVAAARELAQRRIALAGYRLARDLNEIFGAAATTTPATTPPTTPAATQTKAALPALHYISRSEINITALLKPAPADDSAQTQADLAQLLEYQAKRTPAQVAQAQKDANINIAVFSQVLGSECDFAKNPKTAKVLEAVGWDIHWITEDAKNTWKRPRPYVLEKRLEVVLDRPQNTSYPSGHTTLAYGWATVLSDIFPDKKAELYKRAAEIGLGRQIGGVHYPTDVAAGKILGEAIGQKIVASPKFQEDLKVIRAELAHSSAVTLPAATEPRELVPAK